MICKPKRPLRADAARNRARVLEVAYQTFADEGLSVPIDEIARRAGVGAGTVYRHFPTKDDLYRAVIEDRLQSITDAAAVCALANAERPDVVLGMGGYISFPGGIGFATGIGYTITGAAADIFTTKGALVFNGGNLDVAGHTVTVNSASGASGRSSGRSSAAC